jgi:predicted transposase YdaD
VLRLGAAVLTTVVYLTARAPREGELAFRVMLGGKEINIWRFEVLRLWELEAKKVVLGGAPGVLALVPLMAGGQDFETIRRAWRAVRAAVPGERVSPAESILLALASERYTVGEIEKLVGRPRMMQSSIWREALAEGKAEGKAEGRVEGRVSTERELCLEFVRRNHPELARRAALRANACEDPAILRRWALAASDPSSDLVRLMGLAKSSPRSSARRPSAVRRKRK